MTPNVSNPFGTFELPFLEMFPRTFCAFSLLLWNALELTYKSSLSKSRWMFCLGIMRISIQKRCERHFQGSSSRVTNDNSNRSIKTKGCHSLYKSLGTPHILIQFVSTTTRQVLAEPYSKDVVPICHPTRFCLYQNFKKNLGSKGKNVPVTLKNGCYFLAQDV